MGTLFGHIYDFFQRNKSLYWTLFCSLFILVGLGATRIQFETNINKMIPHDENVEAMNHILNHTKSGEQLIVTVAAKDTTKPAQADAIIEAQQHLEEALLKLSPQYIQSINALQDTEQELGFTNFALNYLPLLLTDSDYVYLDQLALAPNLDEHFNQLKQLLLSPAGMMAKQFAAQDPLYLMPRALKKLQGLNYDPNYELYNGYIFNKNLNKLSFFISPSITASETGKNKPFIAALDEIIDSVQQANPEISIQYFGGLAVGVANASQMQTDSIITLSLTIVLILGLCYYVFKKKRIALIIVVPVIFGALFGMSMTALFVPQVSIIAIGAGAIILGIAVDFSVHFVNHLRSTDSVKDTVKSLALPLTLGGITTIGAFFALRFAHAPLLQDLGLFAAFSLLGAALFTLIFLPQICRPQAKAKKENLIDKAANWKPEGKKWLLLLVVIITPVLWHFSSSVEFESDLMQLNYMSPKLKAAEASLNQDNAYALSSVFVLTEGKTEQEALTKMEAKTKIIDSLQTEGLIRNSIIPTNLLISEAKQAELLEVWNHFWTPEKITSFQSNIESSALKAGFAAEAFSPFIQKLNSGFQGFDTSASSFVKTLLPSSFAQNGDQYLSITTLKVAPGQRAAVLQSLNADPEIQVTDRQSVSERLLALLTEDFNNLLFISGGLVFLALLIAYGRIELALISFLPMAVSWIWITGLMSILGLKFNVVNIVIATLLFGLGDDYSIFMMDSLMEKYKTGKSHIKTARSAVYLSVLTTIAGLGTLIFAQHPALQSIAVIAVLGLLCVVFISQVLQPFLFNFFIQHRADKGFMPFTLWSFFKTIIALTYFGLGCILMTVVGFLLIKLNLLGKKRGKLLFHQLICAFNASIIKIFVNTKLKIKGLDHHDWTKPVIFIANHSSFMDILLMTMLHPKLVLLTNQWVYRSPIFGAVVRMAEYYPVTEGAKNSVEALKGLVDQGYSIVVFPEGTRSKTDKIGRFHKGAFFLSESLKLDIVPIVINGAHQLIQKGDFLFERNLVNMQALTPITSTDKTWGDDVKSRTKAISLHFKSNYKRIAAETNQPKNHRKQLISGYLYKGPVIEWYAKVKTKLEGNYELLHELLPKSGLIYDLGCGYGYASFQLQWSAPERKVNGIDYDEDKIMVAKHHYKINPSIQFEQADITKVELEKAAGIVISDVLHYLLPEEQFKVLDQCFEALEEGGTLIVRDGVKELADRHKGTEKTEKWSTKILGFNKTQNDLHFMYLKDIKDWAEKKGLTFKTIDNTKNTSNLFMIMEKIPQ